MRKQREYLRLLNKAIYAAEAGIDSYNRVHNPYRNEESLILATNGWELLAKAVLIKKKKSIFRDSRDNTISAAVAVSRLCHVQVLTEDQEDCIQQVISLRHAAAHYLLPDVPSEIMQHLLFFSCKFFRLVIEKEFPSHAKKLPGGYLSMAFAELTTYADKVQKIVSKIKRNSEDQHLVWLLDRGIQFDGTSYMTKEQFGKQYKGKKKVMPHLGVNQFIKNTEMVRLVPVEAPKNYTADITLRKGKATDRTLPVVVKKTDVEADYPYLTKELASKLGKSQNFTAKMIAKEKLKGIPVFHQGVRASSSGYIERYSEAALSKMMSILKNNPNYNPYTK